MKKYVAKLRDSYLNRVEDLSGLDDNDWKRLDFPLVVEEALRKRLHGDGRKGEFACQLRHLSLSCQCCTSKARHSGSVIADEREQVQLVDTRLSQQWTGEVRVVER